MHIIRCGRGREVGEIGVGGGGAQNVVQVRGGGGLVSYQSVIYLLAELSSFLLFRQTQPDRAGDVKISPSVYPDLNVLP